VSADGRPGRSPCVSGGERRREAEDVQSVNSWIVPTRKARLRPWSIQTVLIKIMAMPIRLLTMRMTMLKVGHIAALLWCRGEEA
jgi:hypothetical protein